MKKKRSTRTKKRYRPSISKQLSEMAEAIGKLTQAHYSQAQELGGIFRGLRAMLTEKDRIITEAQDEVLLLRIMQDRLLGNTKNLRVREIKGK